MPIVETPFGEVEFPDGVDPEEVAAAIAEHMRDPIKESMQSLIEEQIETRRVLQSALQETHRVIKESIDMMKQGEMESKRHHAEMKQAQTSIVEELRKPVVPKYDRSGKLVAAQRVP